MGMFRTNEEETRIGFGNNEDRNISVVLPYMMDMFRTNEQKTRIGFGNNEDRLCNTLPTDCDDQGRFLATTDSEEKRIIWFRFERDCPRLCFVMVLTFSLLVCLLK